MLRALFSAAVDGASYAVVVNGMLRLVGEDGRPAAYANFIRNQFSRREVVEAGTALTQDVLPGARLAPWVCDAPGARQDRHACCGTMQLPEYHPDRGLSAEGAKSQP